MRLSFYVALTIVLSTVFSAISSAQGVIPVPGRIEVENYASFSDTTPGNTDGGCRADDVDLAFAVDQPDLPSGCYLTHTKAGEWLGFTISVSQADVYVLSIRVSHVGVGGTFHVEIDEANVTGSLTVPDTQGTHFTTMRSRGLTLAAGLHNLKLRLDTEASSDNKVGFFNYLVLAKSAPFTGTPYQVPGRIEAETFDTNPNGPVGQDVAYRDTTVANLGNAGYRTNEYVDISLTNDVDGTYHVGWTEEGEWLGYTINATETGIYTISARVAHPGLGGRFHVEVDGINVTGAIQVPNTGAWDIWRTLTAPSFYMGSGSHVLYLVEDSVSPITGAVANINYFTLVDPPAPGFLVMPPQNTENEPVPLREMCLFPTSWPGVFPITWPTGWQRMTMFGNAINWFADWANANATEVHNCFANLRNAGKELALEINVVDKDHPTAQQNYELWLPQLQQLAGFWREAGGDNTTMTLVLDEPLMMATSLLVPARDYNYALSETTYFITRARQDFQGIKINLEEPYPHFSWETLANFYGDVNDQARNSTGFGIQFASVDFDWNAAGANADMAQLQNVINNVFGFGFHIMFVAPPPKGLPWYVALMQEGLDFRPWRSQGVNPQLYSIQAFDGGCCDHPNFDPEFQFPEIHQDDIDPGFSPFGHGVRDFSLAYLPIPSLAPGGYLFPDQSLSSADGRFVLQYQGSDGNLVLYYTETSPWTVLWSSGTSGTSPGFVAMQSEDGNLVVYDGSGVPRWSSGTSSPNNAGAFLVVQSDGNLVIYSDYPNNFPLWATGTNFF